MQEQTSRQLLPSALQASYGPGVRVIRRCTNRRLQDCSTGGRIRVMQLAGLIANGEKVVILDHDGTDITRYSLMLMLVQCEQYTGQPQLDVGILHDLIRESVAHISPGTLQILMSKAPGVVHEPA
jgi:polyhydroxyalkanoate synthesis regulator protein